MKLTRLPWLLALGMLSCESSGPHQTIHTGPIRADETWTMSGSPHIVPGHVFISDGATLTIEAGATVLFDSASVLTFNRNGGGRLRALGTAAAPITLRSLDSTAAPGRWVGFALRSNTVSEMHYVDMSGCGGTYFLNNMPLGCLVLGSEAFPDESPELLIDHVTIHDATGPAVILENEARFVPGSVALTVHHMRGYIALMRARESARFPTGGEFVGNEYNEVRLTLDTLQDSITWAGIPWTLVDTVYVEGPKQPVLTILPNDTIRMRGRGTIVVGWRAPGGLQVGSENGQTATFRAADTSWGGITLLWNTIPSSITNALFDNCGRVENSSFGTVSCVVVVGDYYGVVPDYPAPVLRHVTMRALGGGLVLAAGARLGAGSADLTITGVSGPSGLFGSGPPITIGGRSSPSTIPPGVYTNTLGGVIVLQEMDVRHDDTWPNLGVRYLVTNASVGDSTTHPTLTVSPGTTLQFIMGSHLRVGWNAPGAVRVIGTVAEPITLKGQEDRPDAWGGITIGTFADSTTMFEHVLVDEAANSWPVGAFQFYKDIGPVIRNSTISNSAGCGVIIVNQPPWSTDFTAPALGNTFTNNAGGAVCGP